MKRLDQKVKDIVEVRAFTPVQDLSADLDVTLANYRFTDITSDLMAKWIERVAGLTRGVGVATALAGFRGVGKTHFLAAVAAILTRPELRAQIADPHVRTVSEGLSRRPYTVAHVSRGSGTTILEELQAAVAAALDVHPSSLGSSVSEILHEASLRSGEQAFIILFDTALGRSSRVARDDGPLLSEVADIGKSMGMFVGVALDDDIAGADGANSSIARSFGIDYLDQEHLYKIVDRHIFAKESSKVPILREVYQEWRRVLPEFRWSEQRFISLYPMHPATLELAPLIRLYIQDFALLGFASEAGVKILGRPVNSLIGLDELFDSVAPKLRRVEALRETFEAFDAIERDVIAKSPVSTRLSAKLILKGLFLLSLDGQGAPPDGVAAATLIHEVGGTRADVREVLDAFAANGSVTVDDGKYKLVAGGAAATALTRLIESAASDVPEEAVWDLLLRQTSEKFSDVEATDDFGSVPTICTIEWRGAIHRGEIVWKYDGSAIATNGDWTIYVERRGGARPASNGKPAVLWRVAQLTERERGALRRYHVLRSDEAVREQLGESLATQLQIHSIAAERVWQRIFLDEARLSAGRDDYKLVEDAASAHTLAQVLSKGLEPFFDQLYPEHPRFKGSLGVRESSALIANFFGGGAPESAETRRLVDSFAAPLGLGVSSDSSVVATTADQLLELPIVRRAVGEGHPDSLSLDAIRANLSAAPTGLTREAQHLVLAALVAQGIFDFVTVSGNRINHRSLDLQIIWDDIEGLAAPRTEEYAVDRLLTWARAITGNDQLKSLDNNVDSGHVLSGLLEWLDAWEASDTLGRFDQLSDEHLNTRVWKVAAGLKRTFGAMAECVADLLREDVKLVDFLKNAAEIFDDSVQEYEAKTDELALLNKFVIAAEHRGAVMSYVATSDWTGVCEIDDARRELIALLLGGSVSLNGQNDRIESAWARYRAMYADHAAAVHAEAMTAIADGSAVRELVASELWTAFQGVSNLLSAEPDLVTECSDLMRRLRTSECPANAEAEFALRSVCACGSGAHDLQALGALPGQLRRALERATMRIKRTVLNNREELVRRGLELSPGSRVEFLVDSFAATDGFPRLSAEDVRLLGRVFDGIMATPKADQVEITDDIEVELLSV